MLTGVDGHRAEPHFCVGAKVRSIGERYAGRSRRGHRVPQVAWCPRSHRVGVLPAEISDVSSVALLEEILPVNIGREGRYTVLSN